MRIRLRGGAAGKGKIIVKGRGANLGLPATLALSTPLRVQLRRADTGACWDATFSSTSRSHPDLVKARAD